MNPQPEEGKASVKCTCNELAKIYDCKKDCDAEPPIKRSKASVDVLEANCTIADFMGMTKSFDTYFDPNRQCHFEIEDLKYLSSWDWLMPVVEKIEKIKGVHCVIRGLGSDIYSFGKHISNCREETKILTVWQAVIQFIQWHNTQTKKQ